MKHNFEPQKDRPDADWACTHCGVWVGNANETCPDAPGTPEHASRVEDSHKTDDQLVGLLTLLTTMFERTTDAAERIAAALEAHLELATKAADPTFITAKDVRAANRSTLFLYADELGVAKWAEDLNVKLAGVSNPWIRNRCLEALAKQTLTDEDD